MGVPGSAWRAFCGDCRCGFQLNFRQNCSYFFAESGKIISHLACFILKAILYSGLLYFIPFTKIPAWWVLTFLDIPARRCQLIVNASIFDSPASIRW